MYYCFLSLSSCSSFRRKYLRQRNINAEITENTYIAFASSNPNLTLRIMAIIRHIADIHIQRISIGCFRCFFIFLLLLLRIVL